jgi:hypothetical protein
MVWAWVGSAHLVSVSQASHAETAHGAAANGEPHTAPAAARTESVTTTAHVEAVRLRRVGREAVNHENTAEATAKT